MIENPKVTIVIPVYNGANYLNQSIDCALAQTYPNIEILVVNDGSTDNGETDKVAISYGDKIRYFIKENGGVSSALNFATEKMTGKWFSWLSHDDLYFPEKIEKQVEYINNIISNEPNVNLSKIFVHCNCMLVDINGNVVYKSKSVTDGKIQNIEVILKNLRRNNLGGCSFLLPKDCFNDIGGFNEKIRTISDFDYWYRLLLADYQFYQMPDTLVKYRVHSSQVTYKMSDLGVIEVNDFYLWVTQNLLEREEYKTFDNIFFVACCCLEKGYKRAFKEALHSSKGLENGFIYYNSCIFTLPLFYFRGLAKRILRKLFIMIKVK